MLLVNGFNPTGNSFSKGNSKVSNNSRPSVFQSQPDTVSFKSNSFELTNAANMQMKRITKDVMKEYSDVLGPNFKTKFVDPLNEFLKQSGVSIEYTRANAFVHLNGIKKDYKSVLAAQLVDENGWCIHWNSINGEYDDSIFGLSKNEATLLLFKKFIDGKLDILSDNLKIDNVPKKLYATTQRLGKAIDRFYFRWLDTTMDSADLKVARYQHKLKKLMPEY